MMVDGHDKGWLIDDNANDSLAIDEGQLVENNSYLNLSIRWWSIDGFDG